MTLASRDYEEGLIEDLKTPEEATAYLNAALEEDNKEVFLLALKQVTMAQGGITKVAKDSHLNRVSLQRMLSGAGNPRLDSLNNVLHTLGLKFTISKAC